MPPDSAISPLNNILVRALMRVGDAGETDAACRLAAEAWSLLRHDFPREAQRLNGVMHALTNPHRIGKEGETDERQ